VNLQINSEDRRVRRTKKLLKDALSDLLREKSLNRITVSELCEMADINRKSFYNHYPDVGAVLNEIEDDHVNKLVSFLNQESIFYDLENPMPFLNKLTNQINANFQLYYLLIQSGELPKLTQKMKNCLSVCLTDVIDKQAGLDHETLGFYVEFIMAGIASVYQQWFLSEQKMSVEILSGLICKMVCGSIATLKQ